VVRRIFGRTIEKVTGGWRILHYAKLRNLYYSPNTVRILTSRSEYKVSNDYYCYFFFNLVARKIIRQSKKAIQINFVPLLYCLS
jgi:hypothetical protein